MATDLTLSTTPRSLPRAVKALDLQRQAAAAKTPVRVATTANMGTLTGEQTVDGVALKVGDRYLRKDQTAPAENGIFIVRHTAHLRAEDADHPGKLLAGTKVTAQEGTTNAGTTWRLTTTGTIVLGTTSLTWAADGGGGGSGDVVGPASAVSGNVATFNTTTGKLIQDGGTALSALATDAEVTSAISTHAAAVDPHGDRSYADGLFASNDAMLFKGVIDCSANPNYPAASAGHLYKISVAGKIGGASGVNVEVGDTAICAVDGTASGNQATVGANWYVVQVNLDGAVIGPASSTNLRVAVFSGTTGKLLADGGTLLADLLTSASAAATYQTIALAATKAATTDLIDAKGDRLIGSADNTLIRKAAPANGKISVADSAQSDGWKDIDLPWHVSIDPVRVPAYSTTGGSIAAWATYYQFSALNDEVVYNVQLGPGTWTFGLWRTIFTSYGILTVTLDGTTIATLDNYSGGSVNPGQSLTTGISITAPGVYALKLKTTGKNASSSAYNQRLWAIDFTRTA